MFPEYQYKENYEERDLAIIHTTDNMFIMTLAETGGLGIFANIAILAAMVRDLLQQHQMSLPEVPRDVLLAVLTTARLPKQSVT